MEYKSSEWWVARGKADHAAGVPRTAAPDGGRGTADGEAWRKGWDEAEADHITDDGDDDAFELAPVHLAPVNGRLQLLDHKGRVLGAQTNLLLEQAEDGAAAVTVTFTEVPVEF